MLAITFFATGALTCRFADNIVFGQQRQPQRLSLIGGARCVEPLRLATADIAVNLPASEDGLFYVTALVNRVPIRFLVDTGANMVVLTQADAQRAGAPKDKQSSVAVLQTAGGAAPMARVTLRSVQIAGRNFAHVDAAVSRSALPVSLMGHNLLSRLGPIMLDQNSLRFGPPYSSRDGGTR